MRYNIGAARITGGNQIITGTDGTLWLSVPQAKFISLPRFGAALQIVEVLTNTTLRVVAMDIIAPSTVISGLEYAIYSDFTPYHNVPLPGQHDVEKVVLVKRALQLIDGIIVDL